MSVVVTLMIILAVVLNVAGQILLKWRVSAKEGLGDAFANKWGFIVEMLTDPYVIAAFGCVFSASILWIFALSKVQLSWAYPFMGLSFVMILLLSALVFGETLDIYKVLGALLICTGVVVSYMSAGA